MTRIMKSFTAVAFAAVTLATVPAALAQTTVRLINAWPANTAMISLASTPFQEAVLKAGNGTVVFNTSGPEVVAGFEQLQPLSSGVFDLMFSTPAYHQAQTGVGAVLDGLLKTDTAALRESGVIDYLNKYYKDKFGIEILALVQAPANHMVMREPLDPVKVIEGRKIRSNAAFEGIVRQLGAVPVGMSPADAFASMEKGVIDGIAFPLHVSADYRLYEVGKYMTRPAFGHSTLVLMANSAKLAAMPEDVQKLIRQKALEMEQYGTIAMADVAAKQNATMIENGVSETNFSPEVAALVEEKFRAGTLEVARKSAPDDVDALVEFAKSKGMLSE